MRFLICLTSALVLCSCVAAGPADEEDLLGPLPVGFCKLRIISPDVLELTLVTTKKPDPARPEQWDFVDEQGQTRLPAAQELTVLADGKNVEIKRIGFKRRVLYAPLKR